MAPLIANSLSCFALYPYPPVTCLIRTPRGLHHKLLFEVLRVHHSFLSKANYKKGSGLLLYTKYGPGGTVYC